MAVALLYNPRVADAEALATTLAPIVESMGHTVHLTSAFTVEELLESGTPLQCVVTFGGDGTILRVARAIGTLCNGRIPLLGVDFGTLGFLAELNPAEAEAGIRRALAGDCWLEERRFLRAELVRGEQVVESRLALNDVVLARGDGPHAIRLTLTIDGAETARYTADGIIVASPTGSTAYALAAGGPIVAPTMDVLLAMPVAPHLAISRGFVLPHSSVITLTASAFRTTVVTLDGQDTLIYEPGDAVRVTSGPTVARFMRLGPPNYFYTTLQDRLTKK